VKKTVTILLAAALLLGAAGCGNADFPAAGPAAGESSAVSAAREPSASHEAEPTPPPEAVTGDGGDLDLLSSSPYYSGQEALLEEICHISTRRPPESFYWLDEDTARAAWGIDGYVSACCKDFVACFDFQRPTENQIPECFYVFVALFPGVDLPQFDASGIYQFTPTEDWSPAEGHSGFETMEVKAEVSPSAGEPMGYMDHMLAEDKPVPDALLPEPTPIPLPNMVRIRRQIDGFWIMVQLPESGLDAFWENADQLFTRVDLKDVEKPFYMESADSAASEAAEE